MNGRHGRSALTLVLAALVGLGPAPFAGAGDDYVEAELPTGEIPEEQLLDVTIDLFSPSIDDHDREELAKQGTQPSVRKAEARFIPTHLRNTLQSTGQWGAVRVAPGGLPWSEISVVGKIEKSHGKELKVEVLAWDATGKKWLDEEYRRKAKVLSYAAENMDGLDPFQSLYNEIANDLVKKRKKVKRKDLLRIREVARLRFAAEFAPDTYGPYLKSDKKGRYKVVRLPDESDPMLVRLGLIRERDDMFVDTLNEYYSDFYARMDKPYDDWRANSYTEQAAYDSLNNKKWGKLLGGAAAIVGAIFLPGNNRGSGMVRDVAVIGGIAAVQSGLQDGAELEIHKAALEELAESFGADVTELVVDVDGRTVELKGSAETQFQQWRALLKQIATTDAALPEDINVTSVPSPPVEADASLSPPAEADASSSPPVEAEAEGGTITPPPGEPSTATTPLPGS
jgi:hypothetical protein